MGAAVGTGAPLLGLRGRYPHPRASTAATIPRPASCSCRPTTSGSQRFGSTDVRRLLMPRGRCATRPFSIGDGETNRKWPQSSHSWRIGIYLSFKVFGDKHYRHDRRSAKIFLISPHFSFKEIQELSWCVLQRILYLVQAVETEVWFFSCCLVINWIDILILLFLNSHWSSFQAKDKHWRVCGPDQLSLTHDQVHFLHIQSM